jgi:hypothetical protein
MGLWLSEAGIGGRLCGFREGEAWAMPPLPVVPKDTRPGGGFAAISRTNLIMRSMVNHYNIFPKRVKAWMPPDVNDWFLSGKICRKDAGLASRHMHFFIR